MNQHTVSEVYPVRLGLLVDATLDSLRRMASEGLDWNW